MQNGDIVGFLREGEINLKKTHVGVIQIDPTTQEVFVLHAPREEGQVVQHPIAELLYDKRYQQLVGIKRGTVRLEAFYQPQSLQMLGFYSNPSRRF